MFSLTIQPLTLFAYIKVLAETALVNPFRTINPVQTNKSLTDPLYPFARNLKDHVYDDFSQSDKDK